MHKIVDLVTHWAAFEEKFPDATLSDFCRHYLAQRQDDQKRDLRHGHDLQRLKNPEGKIIPHIDGELMIILRRIGKFHVAYTNIALEGTGITQIEEFGMMVYIYNNNHPRKTDVIYSGILELSSGTNMLNRLKANGLITEYSDKEDKRSKRLKLTAQGEKMLFKNGERISKLATMMFADMDPEDKQLCIRLLKGTDEKYTALYPRQKNMSFEEIYKTNCP